MVGVAFDALIGKNTVMELTGHVENGVIVLDGGATLPEGEIVKVIHPTHTVSKTTTKKKFADLPFVKSDLPGTHLITPEMIADALEQEDIVRYSPFIKSES